MINGLVIGFFLAVAILVGSFFYYRASGIAPVATADPPMPSEKKLTHMALDSPIEKQHVVQSPAAADEPASLASANVYEQHCATYHGMPGQPPSDYGGTMYPKPTQFLRATSVTDHPASEIHWKAANGTWMSGMPALKSKLADKQLWQVSQLVAHANEIPKLVKKVLSPDVPGSASATLPAPPSANKSTKNHQSWEKKQEERENLTL